MLFIAPTTNYQIVKHDIVFILPSQYPSPVASKNRECCGNHKPFLIQSAIPSCNMIQMNVMHDAGMP